MPSKKKIDYKKEFPDLYNPKETDPAIKEIPAMTFFMVDGKGDPNTSQDFQAAMQLLYGASYTLKMNVIKDKEYVVPPLEGLWYVPNMADFSTANKDAWMWTVMIRIPDFATEDQIKTALNILKEKKNPPAFEKLRYEQYQEGTVVQLMHIGSFATEGPNIARMHKYAKDQGYELAGKHHELYISDPRRVAEAKKKTVLRQPIKKKN